MRRKIPLKFLSFCRHIWKDFREINLEGEDYGGLDIYVRANQLYEVSLTIKELSYTFDSILTLLVLLPIFIVIFAYLKHQRYLDF